MVAIPLEGGEARRVTLLLSEEKDEMG